MSTSAFENMTSFQQSCAVPFRLHDGVPQYCLITSIRRRRWGFPKGLIDPGDTIEEAALKEALEEAGLRGRIVGDRLGAFRYKKWGMVLNVAVVLMRVDACEETWLEADVRQRKWMTQAEALEKLERHDFKEMLSVASSRLAGAANKT